jgi:AcrR family transcriptional regulator
MATRTKQASKTSQPAAPPPAGEPETKGARTRSALIETGYQLFIEKGYHGTSMREIADEAGLALGGIYNHFANKEDIFVAVLTARNPYLKIFPALQAAQGETVEELVRDAATRMIKALGESRGMMGLMFVEQIEFNGRHIRQIIEVYYPAMKEFIQRLSEVRGPLRPIPPLVLLRAFIGLFFSYYMTEMLVIERLPARARQDTFDHFIEIYLHGVLA